MPALPMWRALMPRKWVVMLSLMGSRVSFFSAGSLRRGLVCGWVGLGVAAGVLPAVRLVAVCGSVSRGMKSMAVRVINTLVTLVIITVN